MGPLQPHCLSSLYVCPCNEPTPNILDKNSRWMASLSLQALLWVMSLPWAAYIRVSGNWFLASFHSVAWIWINCYSDDLLIHSRYLCVFLSKRLYPFIAVIITIVIMIFASFFCVIFNSCKGQAVLCHHVISRVCCTDNVTHISSENNMETLKRETFNSPEMLLCCRLFHHFGSLFLKQISHQQLHGLPWHVHMYSSQRMPLTV